ncbi:MULTISPECIES: ABC transporter ATP-binding protein [Collinsella]|uniref:ABC transporter ATP-binding protein n=1 Tax=Collinsella TaxID=102106 RepID=UPI000E4D2021|nr:MULTISPECIES: ABC transporter ATP-binding protein [Collinsella]RHD35219.1 ABC transporter ATP-binding protein [Collinsella sp. AM31-2AC]
MGEFVPRPKTLGGDIPCLDSPELARKRQKALSARAELRAERLLRAEPNLETTVETQADGAPLFHISDLSAGYDKKVVVEGVDLEVRAGDVVALIGPNGSGKSTILKTITRHLAPLAGAVELDGREVSRWKTAEFARNLAVMLTDRPRTELLTCRDVVEAGRHPYTGRMGTLSPDDQSRVDEAMKTAHVEELAERDFMQISDGQRQRVMLARAIAQDPRVLVLDEPTSYLDIRYQIDLLRILRHLAKSRNVAVIMSIHELELAQKSADKVICVKDGRVFRAGAPEDIFTRETIGELYGLQHGTFNERFGSVEIGRPHGDAHTFVIAGAGTGSAVFRQLIRQGKAFYAGVLHEGDIDCELARDLAMECVAERAFEPIGDKTIARAKELLVHCARLIVCPAAFGTINARNAELVEFARSHGIEVMRAREGASEDSQLGWKG